MSLPQPFDIPDTGYDAAFGPDAGEQPAGAVIFNLLCSDSGEATNGPCFADFDFLFHAQENACV